MKREKLLRLRKEQILSMSLQEKDSDDNRSRAGGSEGNDFAQKEVAADGAEPGSGRALNKANESCIRAAFEQLGQVEEKVSAQEG